ncbi:MFS transporter [Pseudogemmobacter sonorensis]|uniref:MFS transporter n=1 Tax=Pseudogemmobacter sonorensis TaxID=2989681 RepID=UPI0036AD9FAB
MDTTQQISSNSDTRRNVIVLVIAQAVLGAQMPIVFTVAGLAGQSLAPNICWATLPITLSVLGSMLAATPISAVMQRFGRRAGFALGTLGGAAGGAFGAAGLWSGSFALFCLGAFLTGIYMSAQGFYRFAAADSASEAFRPKAISWVMAGGLFAALIGPQIVKLTAELWLVPFMASYAAVMALNLIGPVLFLFLKVPPPETATEAGALRAESAPRSRRALLREPAILVSIVCATVSYALMNLVMTSSPLAVVGCGFTSANAADVVSAHVLAMYLPSFFTGHLIARFGAEKVVATGLFILAGAGAVAMSGVALGHFFAALVLLGLGWNFGFIGATAMLTREQRGGERGRLQGLNDTIVFGGVTLASLSSGGLMNCSGGSVEQGWQLVNMAMLPFLVLAGGALIWFALRPKETR